MKKIISIFLILLISVSLVACGTSARRIGNMLKSKEKIEITMDNWNDYFEIKDIIKPGVEIEKNDFDEIENIKLVGGTYFILKEEYIKRFVSSDIAIEYNTNQAKTMLAKYNIKEENFESKYLEDDYYGLPFYEWIGNRTNNICMDTVKNYEYLLTDKNGKYGEFVSIEGNIADIYFIMYTNCEITRIKGTLTITK